MQLFKVFGYLRSHPQQDGVHRPLLERRSAAVEWGGSLCTPRDRAAYKQGNHTYPGADPLPLNRIHLF